MRVAPFIMLLALVACTYNPKYDGITCGPNGSCPEGYSCFNNHCLPTPDGMPDEEPAEEAVHDGDAGTDDVGADDGGGDDGGAGDDGSTGDDGGDSGCGGCPAGQYCNAGTCEPCQVDTHCGTGCQPCAAGESCVDRSGTFCCFSACDENSLCALTSCNGVQYVCRAFFGPLRYDWNPVNTDPPHWCRLSTEDGPILDDLRCRDSANLQYYCPWDGMCSSGQCVPNPTFERLHYCGPAFGCQGDSQSGYCRMHRNNGESCTYNFDCESYCCSRDNSAQCIAYNATQCKIHTTLYWEAVVNLYTWIAKGTTDFHDIDQWTFQGGDAGTICAGAADCDSGLCRNFVAIGEKRCEFDTCVNTPEADGIKTSYFCTTGDHAGHILFVTNQNPLPPPNACD